MSVIDIYQYDLTCEVIKVIDGDTIVVLTDFGVCKIKQNIRLSRIDAPEKSGSTKELGLFVKQYLTHLILKSNNIVRIITKSRDMYGRVLGECILENGLNISDHFLETKICKFCKGKRSDWTVEECLIAKQSIDRLLNNLPGKTLLNLIYLSYLDIE